ncbi:DMT family transporter [Paenibacillus sp. FSL R5-0527]|uniref:DMT family transporter n=1 Tax=Paenibacillus sp. FSL R5-0527 TaxID=2975321 RepID=UPI00097AABC3|nr:EamA family transporter [Paenibacillus macerans]
MRRQRKMTFGHLLSAATIIIWGTTFVSTKILLTDFLPIEILFFRFTLGFVFLLLLYPYPVKSKSWSEELLFVAAGLCGVTLYFLLENVALTYTLAANVGVIVSIVPFFTAVLAHFLLKDEPLTGPFIAGFGIALTGIAFIMFNGRFLLQVHPIGDLLALLASAVWAVYSVIMRKISELKHPTIGATRKVFFYGLLFMLPLLRPLEFKFGMQRFLDLSVLANLLFLGLGASALCFVTWNLAVGILGAVKTSVYIYIVPVITVAASALFLHEEITWATIIGTLLTLAGSYISERKPAPKLNECNRT